MLIFGNGGRCLADFRHHRKSGVDNPVARQYFDTVILQFYSEANDEPLLFHSIDEQSSRRRADLLLLSA
jgi:hypothetical protein